MFSDLISKVVKIAYRSRFSNGSVVQQRNKPRLQQPGVRISRGHNLYFARVRRVRRRRGLCRDLDHRRNFLCVNTVGRDQDSCAASTTGRWSAVPCQIAIAPSGPELIDQGHARQRAKNFFQAATMQGRSPKTRLWMWCHHVIFYSCFKDTSQGSPGERKVCYIDVDK